MANDGTEGRRLKTLRLDPREMERAKALIGAVSLDPIQRARGDVTEAAVLQLAVVEGLTILERRYDVGAGAADEPTATTEAA